MNFIDALCDGRVLLAIGIHAVLAMLEPCLEFWIERRFHDNPPALWLREHLGLPLLRAACVVLFVYLAYPALFGLREAPSLMVLLAAHENGTSTVVGASVVPPALVTATLYTPLVLKLTTTTHCGDVAP